MLSKAKKKFQMPKWMDCSWRRVPCGKNTCAICGRIAADRRRHIQVGENPDDPEMMFRDVSRNLRETLEMIKKDAARMGIDITNLDDAQEPPEPEAFPFYRKVAAWHKQLSALISGAEMGGDLWLATEAGADVVWYKNTLLAKVYRQLSTRWEKKQGMDYGEEDLVYTARVLKEVVAILKRSLYEVSRVESSQRGGLFLSLVNLGKIEEKIFKL